MSRLSDIGLTINDELRGKTERKAGVYKQVNEDFERGFNKANCVYRKS